MSYAKRRMVSGASVRSYSTAGLCRRLRTGCMLAGIPGSGIEQYGDPKPSSGGVFRGVDEGRADVGNVGDGVADEDA